MQIEILDTVWSKFTSKEDIEKILPCLTYEKEGWMQGQYSKEKVKDERYMVNHGSGRFLTGLIPRIVKYSDSKNLNCQIKIKFDPYFYPPEIEIPSLPGFTFRPDQLESVQSIINQQRGVIKNATGTGKTVLAGTICSIWPSSRIVFLCHTLSLLNQAQKTFTKDFGFKNVITLGGGENEFDWPDRPTIVIATIQTFRKFDLLNHSDWIDVVICDECHHLAAHDSMMAEILKKTMAPIRIGFSAELPKTEQGRMTLEGYLGPVIGEFSYQDGIKAGVLAKPLFNLVPVPYNDEIGRADRYSNDIDKFTHKLISKGMYQLGIIENKARNRLALMEAIKSVDAGKTVLILTGTNTDHGKILSEMAKDLFDLDLPFIYGKTEAEARVMAQELLESKNLSWAVANIVWREGINIKSLDHVVNIGGEKYPTQIVGRGCRTTEMKKFVSITDFLDPYKWLNNHTVMRLIVYAQQGWLDWKNNS